MGSFFFSRWVNKKPTSPEPPQKTMATSCIDLWNHDMNVLNHYTDILNKNNELEDPYAREALRIEKKIARNNIPIPLYRMLVNAINNFPMLKYHVRASIEKLERIHDCLYHVKYEGTERDCMRRSAEMILELYAKLGWEDLQAQAYLSEYKKRL